MPLTVNKIFRINVSSDMLTATLLVNGETPPGAATAAEIVEQVKEIGIVVDQEGQKAINEFAGALKEGGIPKPIVIARGQAPQHDKPGHIEKLYEQTTAAPAETPAETTESTDQATESTESPDESAESPQESEVTDSGRQSHYERSSIITVKEDQLILRIAPPISGKNGVDVYGKEIPRKLGIEAQVRIGLNVRQEEAAIFATCSGQLEWQKNKVMVNPKLEINHNVDFSVGNIDFPGDVVIHKNILDLFKVRSDSNITVNGLIEAAEVHAQQDLEGNGGMAGKEKGVFSAGRDIKGKYITNAKVTAQRNVEIQIEIVQCDLVCGGHVIIENGPLVGGRVVARGGAKVKYLGSDADVKTIVELGIDEDLRAKFAEVVPEIKLRRNKAERVRQIVEPLLQNQKYLNAEQKEKATELQYLAYELEESVEKMIEELRQIYQQGEENCLAEIEVTGTVFSNVIVRFPRVETRITKPMSGPLKMMPRKVDKSLRVVAVDSKSGYVRTLDSRLDGDDFWQTLDELFRTKAESKAESK